MNKAAIESELRAKLKALNDREADIEAILGDPGNSDSEENAMEMENDEAWLAIGEVTQDEIRQIHIALRKLERGDYGICDSCHQPISEERLNVIPWTSFCVHCS